MARRPCLLRNYPHWDRMAARAANALGESGCQSGDLIAITAHPNWQTICLLFAAWRRSLIAVLIPPHLPKIAEHNLLSTLPLRLIINDGSHLFANPDDEPGELDLSSPALVIPTSGSSGPPKWAAFTLSQLFESAETVSHALSIQPGDRYLLSLPLHHVGGLGVVLRSLISQATIVFDDKSLPYPDRILTARATFGSLVPTQLYRLLQTDFDSISTRFIIGGAGMPQSLYEKAIARGLDLWFSYGMTEMASCVFLTSNPVWRQQIPFLGSPLPGREAKLLDKGPNEILVRGAPLFLGYGYPIDHPINDWFATRDVGIYSPEFGFAVTGRKDLQFICGGENIQPEEIECALLSHPLVEQAVVVPLHDAEFGAKPMAMIQSSAAKSEILSYLSSRLPKHKIPIELLDLPSSANLKPDRRQLTEDINKNYH
ncbi:MAG: O-succinylbenzoate-CoA ligase [Parachlamydiales bacterium]|nr:O-succinylbenzoate-CoA ligase [Parachlamydiales bacterium]